MRSSSPVRSRQGRSSRESEENTSRASPTVRKRSEELVAVPKDPPVVRILRDTGLGSVKERITCDVESGANEAGQVHVQGLCMGVVSNCEEDLHATGAKEGTLHANSSCMGGESTREVGLYGSVPCMVFSSSGNSDQVPHASLSSGPTMASISGGSTAVSRSGFVGDAEGSVVRQSVAKGQRWKQRARERVDFDTRMVHEDIGIKRPGEIFRRLCRVKA
ncbi:hypothetical protein ACOSP7_014412 [Xanthoceras sorbifolium]